MKLFACLVLVVSSVYTKGQSRAIDDLKNVESMPYICRGEIVDEGCGDTLFWKVVKMKLDVVPALIEKLDDTSSTNMFVPNLSYHWTVADIAYSAINEIIEGIPTNHLLGNNTNSSECPACFYWKHFNLEFKHRQDFKLAVSEWFENNRELLQWKSSESTLTCDCTFKHPNHGYYFVP